MAYLNARANVKVDPQNPRGYGECDYCGHFYNLETLEYQTEWMGAAIKRTGFRQCPECLDKPQEQLRTIVLPPDPIPLKDPRPDKYTDPAPNYPHNISCAVPVSYMGIPVSVLPPVIRAHLASEQNLASDPTTKASDGTGDFLPVGSKV